MYSHGLCDILFLSTLSLRRATYGRINDISRLIFLSTLSLRRATTDTKLDVSTMGISIHALLAESDQQQHYKRVQRTDFYPRSPCGERHGDIAKLLCSPSISIHALLAESDSSSYSAYLAESISIHALLAESDSMRIDTDNSFGGFLSTLSLRRATQCRL